MKSHQPQPRLNADEIASLRRELKTNNALSASARAKEPQGLHPRVAALRKPKA